MGVRVVPKNQFPINMTEMTARLASTYVNLYGVMPSKSLLMFTAGLGGVEHAGGVYIWNGNFGNTTAPGGYDGTVWEANGLQFLDFPTIEYGMTYWWQFMFRRFRPVLESADQGDVDAAVRDLFRLGYLGRVTTAVQESNYRRGVWAYERKVARDADLIVNQTKRDYVGAAVGIGSVVSLGLLGYFAHSA